MTYGQKCVGVSFNPSGDENVAKIKQCAAEMIDTLVNSITGENSELKAEIHRRAVQDVIAAQMMCVKAVTFKD